MTDTAIPVKTKHVLFCHCGGERIQADLLHMIDEHLKKMPVIVTRFSDLCGIVALRRDLLSALFNADADYLVVFEPTQVEPNRHLLRPGGVLITPEDVDVQHLPHKKTLNVALLGVLSAHLPMSEDMWLGALKDGFKESFFEGNKKAFQTGRASKRAS